MQVASGAYSNMPKRTVRKPSAFLNGYTKGDDNHMGSSEVISVPNGQLQGDFGDRIAEKVRLCHSISMHLLLDSQRATAASAVCRSLNALGSVSF